MDVARIAMLLAALLLTGSMVGVFFAFSTAVMPALRALGDREFVAAFQHMDRTIVNPRFLTVLIGAPIATGVAGLLHLHDGPVLAWTAAALGSYLAVVVITGRVHLPRNDALRAQGTPEAIEDPEGARARFDEDRWRRWNSIRGAANLISFACLAIALTIA